MPLRPDLLADLYDFYLRAAVELRYITLLECRELRRLRDVFGIGTDDLEQIREALVSRN